jgi:hypothetical protein
MGRERSSHPTLPQPVLGHADDLPDDLPDRFAVTEATARGIDAIAELVGRSRAAGPEGWFSLFDIEMGAARREAAERNHQGGTRFYTL